MEKIYEEALIILDERISIMDRWLFAYSSQTYSNDGLSFLRESLSKAHKSKTYIEVRIDRMMLRRAQGEVNTHNSW